MPHAIARSFHSGELEDRHFDRLYPTEQRLRSWSHWTPLDVARRACALLAPTPGGRILDVGAGVGKVCLVGALTTDAAWVGVERDREMVEAAQDAARQLGVEARASFVHGGLTSVDWASFDAFYLFNPFGELLLTSPGDALTRRETYVASIEDVQARLAAARPGTRVVTYHGFGGDMPWGYELLRRETAHEDELRLWVRREGAGPPRR